MALQMKHKCDVRVQLESGESFYLDVSVYNPSCASFQNETSQTLMAKKVAAKRVEYKHVGISSGSSLPSLIPLVTSAPKPYPSSRRTSLPNFSDS